MSQPPPTLAPKAMLLTAFQNHTQPLLAKFTLDPTDIEHEHRVPSELADVPGILKTTLDCIHDKGYGHNDIKAANVFLDSKGE
ncbi:hypothetical protein V8C86DRAFT_3097397 [Haematococcus lacustris]